jgi:hypothetical protein
MRRVSLALCLGLVAGLVAGIVVSAQSTQKPSVNTVVARATTYVAEYERTLGMLIAEERCDQRAPETLNTGFSGGSQSSGRSRFGGLSVTRPRRIERRMKSDFLMMRLPNGGDQWVGLRVAVEVDGRAVGNRTERMQTLFDLNASTASILEQWHVLAEESARFNLGNIVRTTNVPTFALMVLHAERWRRFAFELADTDRLEGQDVWEIRFRESTGPMLISDPVRRLAVPTHGRLWIQPDTGLVVRTELKTGTPRDGQLRSEIVVRYRPDDDLGVWLPRDMKEKYEDRHGLLFEGDARYSNFQRFGVSTNTGLTDERGEQPREPQGE